MGDLLDVKCGEEVLGLSIPRTEGFVLRARNMEGRQLMLEALPKVEVNAALSSLGSTASASVAGEYTVNDKDELLLNNATNNTLLSWLIVDFHKELLINEMELFFNSFTETKYVELKIWGGKIFFPTSPQVMEDITAGETSKTFRFAEQKTSKVLVEFTKDDTSTPPKKISTELMPTKVTIKSISLPEKLTLRIGDQAPFSKLPAVLAPNLPTPLPDFSKEINDYLENGSPKEKGGDLIIPLHISSLSDGKVLFSIQEGESTVTIDTEDARISDFGFMLEGIMTKFLDSQGSDECIGELEMRFDGEGSVEIYLPIPAGVTITEACFRLKGALSRDQMMLSSIAGRDLGALCSEKFLLAQSIFLNNACTVTGYELEMEFITDKADLSVAIYPDFSNQPADAPLEEATSGFSFPLKGKYERTGEQVLVRFDLPSALELKEGRYWLVLSVAGGEVTWRINDSCDDQEAFLFSRPESSTGWIRRMHPTAKSCPVSAGYRVYFLQKEASEFVHMKIGPENSSVEWAVTGIDTPEEINMEVSSLTVNDTEKALSEVLQDFAGMDGVTLSFKTTSRGMLNLSDFMVRFDYT